MESTSLNILRPSWICSLSGAFSKSSLHSFTRLISSRRGSALVAIVEVSRFLESWDNNGCMSKREKVYRTIRHTERTWEKWSYIDSLKMQEL